MPRKIKVPVKNSPAGVATVEDGATYGATIGVNVFKQDGTLYVPGTSSSSSTSSPSSSGTARTGTITPAQLTANTDDWAPTDLSTAAAVRLSTDASRNITGLTGGAAGRELLLVNIGVNDAVLVHDATSTAANRFLCPGSGNLTLNPNDSAQLWYDATSERWRVVGV